MRKHGLFIAVVGILLIAIVVGLALSPKTENGRWSWSLPQVRDGN